MSYKVTSLLLSFPLFTYVIELIKDFFISMLKTAPIPKHIGLIMDGNRRYAKSKDLSLKDGHSAGADSLIQVLNTCYKLGVLHVTVYAFSIENFNRSKEEVDTLFTLLRDRLRFISEKEESYARLNNIRIKIIGNRTMIPNDILMDLEVIEERTKNINSAKVLNVCFPYTSRDDIVHSIQSIAEKVESKEIESKESITLETLNNNMYMGPITPPLDVLIRTSGHTRLSDFMLWQCNYNCTIEFVDTLWPNFKSWDIMLIIMKWSYYKTLQLEQQRVMNNENNNSQKVLTDILKELPPHPPFASITQR